MTMSYMLGLCDLVKTALGEKVGGGEMGGGGGGGGGKGGGQATQISYSETRFRRSRTPIKQNVTPHNIVFQIPLPHHTTFLIHTVLLTLCRRCAHTHTNTHTHVATAHCH